MAKTYLDQLVDFPANIIQKISSDNKIVGLLLNKPFDNINEDDYDEVLDNKIFDYEYVDETTQEAGAYVWVEIEIPNIQNKRIKNCRIYITIACHKDYMKLNSNIYKGVTGNRRDNLIRYIDRILNSSDGMGIGQLSLGAVRTVKTVNRFVIRELTYSIPDFNVVDLKE